jgi:hypothetical protein
MEAFLALWGNAVGLSLASDHHGFDLRAAPTGGQRGSAGIRHELGRDCSGATPPATVISILTTDHSFAPVRVFQGSVAGGESLVIDRSRQLATCTG